MAMRPGCRSMRRWSPWRPVHGGGYFMAAADGGIFDYGGAPFYGSMGGQHAERPDRRHGSHTHGEGVLARRGRRRDLRLRRRAVLRLHGRPPPELSGRRHGAHADRQGLLARRGRRRDLRLRRRALLRLHGRPAPQLPGRRHGAHTDRQGVLARRGRRRDLRLRRRRVRRLGRLHPLERARRGHGHPSAPKRATGSSRRTAGSSRTAAPRSSGHPHDPHVTPRRKDAP